MMRRCEWKTNGPEEPLHLCGEDPTYRLTNMETGEIVLFLCVEHKAAIEDNRIRLEEKGGST